MGEWTTSYRWAGVQRSNIVGLLRHDARDVDRANGVEVAHSNKKIDARFTDLNVSLVNDGSGALVPMNDVEQAVAFLDRRIGETRNTRVVTDPKTGEAREVPVALRSDAAAAVEFVLQLDPEYTRDQSISQDDYEALTPAEYEALPIDAAGMTLDQITDVKRLLSVMVQEVTDQFGAENVICTVEHWDETHPHIQMLVVPVTADRAISMKQVLGGAVPGTKPTKAAAQERYRELHDSMRERLQDAGYDATMERVAAGKRHVGLASFKAQQDRQRAVRAAAVAVTEREAEVLTRESKASARESLVIAAFDQIDYGRSELHARQAALSMREAEVVEKERDLSARQHEAELRGYADGMAAADAAVARATTEERQRLAAATQLAEQARAAAEAQRVAMLAVERTAADLVDELRAGTREMSKAAAPGINAAWLARNAAVRESNEISPSASPRQEGPDL